VIAAKLRVCDFISSAVVARVAWGIVVELVVMIDERGIELLDERQRRLLAALTYIRELARGGATRRVRAERSLNQKPENLVGVQSVAGRRAWGPGRRGREC
jgi:hypothetical protein